LQQSLRLVSSVVQAFSETTTDYRKLLDAIAEKIAIALPDMCVVSLQDEGMLTPVAVHDIDNRSDEFRQILQQRFALDDAKLSAAAMSSGPVFMPEIDFDDLERRAGRAATDRLRAIGARGMILVPLAFRGELHGVMTVIRHRPEHPPLDELDFEILKDLGVRACSRVSRRPRASGPPNSARWKYPSSSMRSSKTFPTWCSSRRRTTCRSCASTAPARSCSASSASN
jgi:hypothetical protein